MDNNNKWKQHTITVSQRYSQTLPFIPIFILYIDYNRKRRNKRNKKPIQRKHIQILAKWLR